MMYNRATWFLLQIQEHHYKHIISVRYNRATEGAFYRFKEHQYKDILSDVYNMALHVEEHHYKDILSMVYNMAI